MHWLDKLIIIGIAVVIAGSLVMAIVAYLRQ